MHDIEIPAQKQHSHNETPCRPIEEKCQFFPSTLFNKTDVYENSVKYDHSNCAYIKFCLYTFIF